MDELSIMKLVTLYLSTSRTIPQDICKWNFYFLLKLERVINYEMKEKKTHDEFCRKCGGKLVNWSSCYECKKPIKRICVKCGSHTDEMIHVPCFYHVEPFQTQISVELGSAIKEPEMIM